MHVSSYDNFNRLKPAVIMAQNILLNSNMPFNDGKNG